MLKLKDIEFSETVEWGDCTSIKGGIDTDINLDTDVDIDIDKDLDVDLDFNNDVDISDNFINNVGGCVGVWFGGKWGVA